jgi:hypothetical protein
MMPVPPPGGASAGPATLRIQAIVQGSGPGGLLITTPAGRFVAGGLPELPAGARLTLELPRAGASPAEPQPARLLSVDGRPATRPVTLTPAPQAPAPGPAVAQPTAPRPEQPTGTPPAPARPVGGQTAGSQPAGPQPAGPQPAATQSAATQSAATQSAATQSAATQSAATQSGATQSGATQSGATQSGATQSGAAQSGAAQSGAAQSGAAQSRAAQSGAAHPTAARPGNAPAPGAPPPAGPPTVAGLATTARLIAPEGGVVPVRILPAPGVDGALAADVRGRDALGRLLLQAAGLTLRLESAELGLPAEARVGLLLPRGLPQPSQPSQPGDPVVRLLARLAGLGEDDAVARRLLPRPDARMAARLIGLTQLLRGGAEPPRDAGPGLREALAELAATSREPLAGGWKAMILPVLVEDEVETLRLYHREETEADAAGARAVLDLELSHLGRMQLDLLCRAARLDVVVRSEGPLPDDLGPALGALLEGACRAAGLAGGIRLAPGELLPLPAPGATPADLTV